MDHEPVLIATIAIGLTAAFIGGFVARRLGLPAIVGYLIAGVAVGPFTPGLIADAAVATELAEIGVILLMFGVGIEFSVRDLLAVRSIAVPGAVAQVAIGTTLGVLFGVAIGWGPGPGLILGLATSVASTVVLLRALMERNELDTRHGRIAVGWLIVEDLFIVLVLVLLPTLAPLLGGAATGAAGGGAVSGNIWLDLAITLGKAAIFAMLMLVAGARIVPRLLVLVARDGSREMFTLAVLAIALGIAFAASAVFGVSLALGAFLAGAVVSESDVSHQAAADALPLRDAFAVLFFVSVGMLVDPAFLVAQPLAIAAIVVLIVAGKALTKLAIALLLGHPLRTALTVAIGLAQIGEFSFIVGTVGLSLGLLPSEGFQLIVAGAILSITLNGFLFRAIDPLEARLQGSRLFARLLEARAGSLAHLDPAPDEETLRRHAIVCGYGRVGRMIGPALERRGFRYVVITQDRHEVEALRARDIPALYGDAGNPGLLERANVAEARLLIGAISDPNVTRLIVERARQANPGIDLVLRTHSDSEAAHLRSVGGSIQAVHGERELAIQMTRFALRRFGVSGAEAEAIAQGLRGRGAVRPARPTQPAGPTAQLSAWWRSIRGGGEAPVADQIDDSVDADGSVPAPLATAEPPDLAELDTDGPGRPG